MDKKQDIPPSRVIIDRILPDLYGGRFAAKAALHETCAVEAIILCDGHEVLKADLLYRHEDEKSWRRTELVFSHNDTYCGGFRAAKLGRYEYTVEAAIDRYGGWRDGFLKKARAGALAPADWDAGLQILQAGLPARQSAALRSAVEGWQRFHREHRDSRTADPEACARVLFNPVIVEALRRQWADPSTVRYGKALPLAVDPPHAVFSAWYEFFPRSRWQGYGEEGTLRTAAARLDYVADLGFDVVYLPPIHPIGKAGRKGRNNSLHTAPGDVGSPWAIGSAEGGHKAIHPALGDFDDFSFFVEQAKTRNLEVALDIAFQCAPDHPYVREHPAWFKKRADGSIQYAENPPKKYQDIYPLDFESADWRALWDELRSVILFWVEKGVRIFRVDNPHTKSFHFWEWAIADIRAAHPDVIFLAEAFTRPHVMAYLAKIGFNQSYTYFAWRETGAELQAYMKELTQTELGYYFRPNFWPNTPDILTASLQSGQRSAAALRAVLAATLSASYGIYGPAFELLEHKPQAPGKEEYLDSEKYEVREWDVAAAHSLAPLLKTLNKIRRENPALHRNRNLCFHPVTNEQILAYTKQEGENLVLTVVNLDPHNKQSGIIDLQIHMLGLDTEGTYMLRDLLSEAQYVWSGWKNFVELDPAIMPAHVFLITQEMTVNAIQARSRSGNKP